MGGGGKNMAEGGFILREPPSKPSPLQYSGKLSPYLEAQAGRGGNGIQADSEENWRAWRDQHPNS